MGAIAGAVVTGALAAKSSSDAAKRADRATQQGTAQLLPTQRTGQAATEQMEALLGLSGDPGAARNALRNFMDSTGFQNQLQQGTQAITGSAALGGILNSGATAKALQDRGQQMAQQTLMNYLAMLDPLSARGANAAAGVGSMVQAGGQNSANMRFQGGMAQAQQYGNALNEFGLPQALSGWFGGNNATPTGGIPATADWSTGVPR